MDRQGLPAAAIAGILQLSTLGIHCRRASGNAKVGEAGEPRMILVGLPDAAVKEPGRSPERQNYRSAGTIQT
jgi:hypothetical protein